MDDILTIRQLADEWQCSPKTIERGCQRGEIPAFKVGRLWRFSRATISRWIEESSLRNVDRATAPGVGSEGLTGLRSISRFEVTHAG